MNGVLGLGATGQEQKTLRLTVTACAADGATGTRPEAAGTKCLHEWPEAAGTKCLH